MIRVIIELVPSGVEKLAQRIGLIEIANDLTGDLGVGNYICILKKTPPWSGALTAQWKKAIFNISVDDEEILAGRIQGFDRIKRGPYDLLFRALKACGLEARK